MRGCLLRLLLLFLIFLPSLVFCGRGLLIGFEGMITDSYFYGEYPSAPDLVSVDATVTNVRSTKDTEDYVKTVITYRFTIDTPGKESATYVNDDLLDPADTSYIAVGSTVHVQYVTWWPAVSEVIQRNYKFKLGWYIDKYAYPLIIHFGLAFLCFAVPCVLNEILAFVERHRKPPAGLSDEESYRVIVRNLSKGPPFH